MSPADAADTPAETPGEPDAVTALGARLRARLAPLTDQPPTDAADGGLEFRFADMPCAVQIGAVAPGLELISLSCVVAWSLPAGPALDAAVAAAAERLQFGALRTRTRGDLADVVLMYPFPGTGLSDAALGTMLALVLDGGAAAREQVTADPA